MLLHRRDEQSADRRRLGHRGAADAAEEHAAEDGDVPQAAGDMPHESVREVHESARDAAAVHHLADEHEEGDGEEREAVGPLDDLRGKRHQRNVHHKKHHDVRDAQTEDDGNAEDGEEEENAEKEPEHGVTSPPGRTALRAACRSTSRSSGYSGPPSGTRSGGRRCRPRSLGCRARGRGWSRRRRLPIRAT